MIARWRATLLVLSSSFALSTPAHAAWLPNGTPVCTAPGLQVVSVGAPDGTGGAILAWLDARDQGYAIYAQRIDGTGQTRWTANGVNILASSSVPKYPGPMLADGVGGAFFVTFDGEDTFIQRLDASGVIQWRVQLGSGHRTRDAGLVPDGLGGVIVGWTEDHSITSGQGRGREPMYLVRAQRLDASGQPVWRPSGTNVGHSATLIGLSVASDSSTTSSGQPEGAIFTWVEERIFTGWNITAQRLDSGGQPQWASGVAVCDAPGSQVVPEAVTDGQATIVGGPNGAIVVWHDTRNDRGDIYGQRVDVGGVPVWTTDGIAVGASVGLQFSPVAVSDLESGAIVAWRDEQGLTGIRTVHVNRLDGSGNTLWAPAGIALSGGTRATGDVRIVPDGVGGAILAWPDGRGPDQDVYAQRIAPTSAELWTGGGARVCSASGDQTYVFAIPDGVGGIIACWSDDRFGDTDLYAQRVTGAGTILAVDPLSASVPTSLRLLAPRPNPARSNVLVAFELPAASAARVEVLDVQGRLVRRLDGDRTFPAGAHSLTWDGHDESGAAAPSGVYLVGVSAGGETATRKITLIPR